MQNLSKNTNLLIQKSDKGNLIIILDKEVYIKHIKLLLSDKAKIENTDTIKGFLNFTVNREKRINKYLKSLKSSGASIVEQHKKTQDLVFYMVFLKYIKIY